VSDFLTNLLARGRGASNAIMPRVPGLFEPVQTGIGPGGSGWEQSQSPLEAVTETEPATSTARRADSQENHEQSSVRRSPAIAVKSHEDVMSEPVSRAKGALPLQPSREDAAVLARLGEIDVLMNKFRSMATRANEGEPGHSRQSFRPAETLPVEAAGSSIAPVERAVTTEKLRAAPRTEVQPEAELSAGSRSPLADSAAQLPPQLVAKPARLPQSDSRGNQRDVASPAEPVIQVTIGRVEVRAIREEPSVRKPMPRSPVPSLEEYLRERTRGARQ